MADVADIEQHLLRCLARRRIFSRPFRHWRLYDVLPREVYARLASLPLRPRAVGDTAGKRETHNRSRLFFSPDFCRRFRVCAALAASLQEPDLVRRVEQMCRLDLSGAHLRIEYCLDRAGFWLEPHTDIGAKLFTMQIYISPEPEAVSWGTDLLDGAQRIVVTVPAVPNSALVFVPAANTWHGFHKRPIGGIRRSIVVNYVRDEWRSRHELVDPVAPVKPSPAAEATRASAAPHSGGGTTPVCDVIRP